ncbi:SAM domain-containing protein [Verrucomicrobium spinosum]|uniref:SAM domain-containing protein n=1 Tax=Verrucomicrobium spinosum TaxID=2736 RepID=UPI00155DD170
MTDPTTDIQAWLESHGLDELLSPFIENDITVDLLPTLSGEELREMGVTSLGLRKKALAAIAALQSAPPEPAWVPAAEKVHAPAPPVIRFRSQFHSRSPALARLRFSCLPRPCHRFPPHRWPQPGRARPRCCPTTRWCQVQPGMRPHLPRLPPRPRR